MTRGTERYHFCLTKFGRVVLICKMTYFLVQVGNNPIWDSISQLGLTIPIEIYLPISIGISRVICPAHERRFQRRKMVSTKF